MRLEATKRRILLAEKDILQRLLIREYLEIECQYEVVEAGSVHVLLGLCQDPASREALLLLDVQWSRSGQMDVLQEIRKRSPGILILVMTDYRPELSEESRFRKLRLGILPKPFSVIQLNRCMAAALRAGSREKSHVQDSG
jgi:DNA-binding NtrC family response regulator